MMSAVRSAGRPLVPKCVERSGRKSFDTVLRRNLHPIVRIPGAVNDAPLSDVCNGASALAAVHVGYAMTSPTMVQS